MKALFMNMRGLNKPSKQRGLKTFLHEHKIDIAGLLETKIKINNVSKLQNNLGMDWSIACNHQSAPNGRVMLIWNTSKVTVSIVSEMDQCIMAEVRWFGSSTPILFTVVYGRNDAHSRERCWRFLQQTPTPLIAWLLGGDFNATLKPDERISHSGHSHGNTELQDIFYDLELTDIRAKGWEYTWHNRHDVSSRVYSKLDRVAGNIKWMNDFPLAEVDYVYNQLSDHWAGVVYIHADTIQGAKPFRFFSHWADHEEFQQLVQDNWVNEGRGVPLFLTIQKLRKVKFALKQFAKQFRGLEKQIHDAKSELAETHQQLRNDLFNSSLVANEKSISAKLDKLLQIEESSLRQKAGINWIKSGDGNTKFFHAAVKARRSSNKVTYIYNSSGNKIEKQNEIQDEFMDFFRGLMGTCASSVPAVNTEIVSQGSVLSLEQQLFLARDYTKEEVKAALWDMGEEKSPGPDGFTVLFYKKAWPVIHNDICEAVLDVLHSGKMIRSVNCTSITLVPKVSSPLKVSEFRPISCCNVLYKIIAKVLANRMSEVLGSVIHEEQSAFVKGRKINDNVILAHEIVKHYGRKHISPRCLLKVDLRKAYDSIEWPFLEQMLYALHFPTRYVQLLMLCITTVSYSLSYNGTLLSPLMAKKRLRQGDPLSPYLFVVGMEYLSRCLDQLQHTSSFKYHPKCSKFKLCHSIFADDLLLFSRGDTGSVSHLLESFKLFSEASGLVANFSKSEIFFGGVNDTQQEQILQGTSFVKGKLPVKYLGVPLSSKRLSIAQCQPVIDKILARLNSWTSRMLSYAGRLQLLKSVVFSMQSYWSQVLILPQAVINHIETLFRRFLWTGSSSPSRRALVAWEQVCTPKSKGGLGVLNLKIWNAASIGKLVWDIHHSKERLWIQWISMYYIKRQNFWAMESPAQSEWMIKRIFDDRTMVKAAVLGPGKYTISRAYRVLLPDLPAAPWSKLCWSSLALPKYSFCMWLVCMRRLPTLDRMIKMGLSNIANTMCSLCNAMPESHSHLFFECTFSRELLDIMLRWASSSVSVYSWEQVCQWAMSEAVGKSPKKQVIKAVLIAVCHAIWEARNARVFKHEIRYPMEICRRVIYQLHVRARASGCAKLMSWFENVLNKFP